MLERVGRSKTMLSEAGMASINRGDSGQRYRARISVRRYSFGSQCIHLICERDDDRLSTGFPIQIRLTPDEALKLCADLASSAREKKE